MKKEIIILILASLILGMNGLSYAKHHHHHHPHRLPAGAGHNSGIIHKTGNVAGNVVNDTGRVVDDAARGAAGVLKNL